MFLSTIVAAIQLLEDVTFAIGIVLGKKLRIKRSVLHLKDFQEFLREQSWAIGLIGFRCFDKGPPFVKVLM